MPPDDLGFVSGFRSFRFITARAEVVGAFVGLEDIDKPADEVPEAAHGSLADLSEHGLEAREGLFDRFEVGAVGRQEAQGCTCCFDEFAHRGALVAREVVHDDDIAAPQLGHEHLGDIGFEPVAVDRSVEHHRRDHAGHAQPCDQRGGFAVSVREAHAQTLALGAAAMAAGHVGGSPGLVDKDKALGLEIGLPVEPVMPLLQDIGTVLLDSMASLFLRVIPRRTKKR